MFSLASKSTQDLITVEDFLITKFETDKLFLTF